MPGKSGQYFADRSGPVPLVNYAINPSFEDGDPAAYTVTTNYVGWTRGWAAQKGAAGDTISLSTFSGAGVDTLYGGFRAAQVVKVGTAGVLWLLQAVPTRISRHFWNRTFTLGIRVACNAVGIARLAYLTSGGAYQFTAANVKADSTYETLYVTIPAGSHNGNSIVFGLNMPSPAGTVNIDNVFLVDGAVPPSPLQLSASPQNGPTNIWDSFYASEEPKCIKSFGNGNFVTLPYNVTTLLPFNIAEIDTEQMGGTNGRITIRSDGRYYVGWGVMSHAASVAGNWYTYCALNGGTVPFRAGNYPLAAAYHNTQSYIAPTGSFVWDFIAGDYLEIYGYVSFGGGTVSLHYNDTFFEVARLGD